MDSKHVIIFIFFSGIALVSTAQMKFTEGYIVTNNLQRIDCLIRQVGKAESTMNFYYRLKEDKRIEKIELSEIAEFGIGNKLKCIRELIAIDVSPDRITHLKDTLQKWEEGHAYLNVLVEGELATLYSYYDHGRPLYFYSIRNSRTEPLVYKRYQLEVSTSIVQKIFYDNTYQAQLQQYLVCDDTYESGKHIPYTKKALVNYFIDYHICKEADYTVFKSAEVNKGSFRLKLGISSNRIKMSVKDYSDALPNATFSEENNLGLGVEAEYLFPFNNYKWSLFVESNFYYYNSDYVTNYPASTHGGYVVNYMTIEVPSGITHYLNVNQDQRLFLRGAFVPHLILADSYIDLYTSDFQETLSSSSRYMLGAGYNYKRLNLEFRYYTPQNITKHIYNRGSNLSQISLRVSYNLYQSGT